ncbi:MAG: hypothetical protein WKF77_12950 [Planctomycetaceae bacterium]
MRPAIHILKDSGSTCEPTSSFATLYRTLTRFLADVFPAEQNPQTQFPPASAAEFVSQRFANAPEFHRQLACELWTLLREIYRDGNQVNQKTLHDHQFAHLIWVTAALTNGAESPTSFFIQGAPGTGKTLTLGVLMQACIRLQTRGLMTGKVAYCTAKPYHIADKVRGKGMAHRRVLRAPPYEPTDKDINRRRLALCRMNGEFMKKYFPGPVWATLFAQRPSTEDAARQIIAGYLQAAELQIEKSDEPMLSNVVKVLASVATAVRGPFGTTELLTFPPIPDSACQIASHTGDAAFAIPPDYPLFARESIGITTAPRGKAHVILEPASVFTSVQQIERYREELHRHVEVILCDEAQRRQPVAFQEPVLSAGALHIPLVFAAGSQWYGKNWDCRSPVHSFPESIRRGILPDLGVKLFPSADDVHFPGETEESLQQLLTTYFQPLLAFQKLGISQPYDANTLVVVHGRLVDTVVERLRSDYKKRGIAAAVRPFHGGEEDREALQIWFDTPDVGPNILVSTASIVKESLDLLSLRHLVVATRVSTDVLYHLIGRLAHGRGQGHGVDRMLVTLQQFANSSLGATPFIAIDHGQKFPDDGFTWINGHALMSDRAFQRDRKRLQEIDDNVKVPAHRHGDRGQVLVITVASGKSLLPGDNGKIIDPTVQSKPNAVAHRLALLPMAHEEYDPQKGPPSHNVVRQWAAVCGGLSILETYPSIFLSVEEAHQHGSNPLETLQQKIAQLRERSHGPSR